MTRFYTLLLILFTYTSGNSQDYFPQLSAGAGTNVRDIKADSFGNVYAVGRGTIQPSCIDTAATEYQGTAYLAKYDQIGNVIWRLNFEGSSGQANGLAIDPNGDLIVVGTFRADRNGIFVTKVSPAGEVIWRQTASGQADDEAFDVAVGADGTIYATGTFNFWVNFGNIELVGTDFNYDPFIWALRPEGFTKWAKQVPSGVLGSGEKIVVDEEGNIVNVGRIYDLDTRKRIIYLSKYSPEGEELFFKKFVVSNSSYNSGLTTDARNNIYMTGYLSGSLGDSIDFDPGPESYVLYGSGPLRGDAYLLKLDENGEFEWVKTTSDDRGFSSASEVEIDPSGNIFVSGIFKNTVDFDPGLSVFELKTNPQYSKTYIQVLDSTGTFITALNRGFLTGGQSYSNLAFELGTDGRLFLGREHPQGFVRGYIDFYGKCQFSTQTEEIIACRKFNLSGIEITSNCTVRTLLPDGAGCGIISNLNIEIIPERDIQIRLTDSTLTSNINTFNINWLDCDADYEIIPDAANNHIFQPKTTGTYAAEITSNGCRDTSDCVYFEVMSTGVDEQEDAFLKTEIFPNPFSEKITIKNIPLAFAEISIFDLSGKLIFEDEKTSGMSKFEISTADFSKGIYVLNIKNKQGILRRKIVKN